MDQVARFKNRKQVLSNVEARHGLFVAPDQVLVEKHLSSPVDTQSVDQAMAELDRTVKFNFDVSEQEVQDLLRSIESAYDAEKFDNLFNSCKESVIASIVGPFGLGKIVATTDKEGGNVTTVHNARQGIYAEDKDRYNRAEYTDVKNSQGRSFAGSGPNSVGSEFTRAQLDNNGNLQDNYTGKQERGCNTSPDHIVSCSEHHSEGGFMLNSKRKADFATDKENLASTRRDINQSMNDDDKIEWLNKKQAGREIPNAENYEVDRSRVEEHYKRGKVTSQKHLPTTTDKAKYYVKNTARTGVSEGAKMGVQQALGLLLTELFQSIFDEIKDIYSNGFASGFEESQFFKVLKKRLGRIAKRVAARWKDACDAFSGGFLSGFLSNIVTVIINQFVTTCKKLGRIIREGFYSLLRAVKLICFPPDGMTFKQAAHEASKLIAGGVVVIAGIAVEEYVSKMISSIPFADIITQVIVGSITALLTTFVVYIIDKIDLFRVSATEKHEYIVSQLEASLDKLFTKADVIIGEMEQLKV